MLLVSSLYIHMQPDFVIILLTLNVKVTCEGHKNSRKCSVTFYWKVTCEGHVANIILFEFLYMENI